MIWVRYCKIALVASVSLFTTLVAFNNITDYGALGQDIQIRTSAGKDWCRLSVGVGEGDEVTWVSVAVFEKKARALAGLPKGAEVYVEGRLSLNAWTGRDGA